jgi:autotransporter translocation and assembly factor TamB
MARFLRNAKRALLALALLAAVVVVAGLIYVRTDSFGRLLQRRISNLLATEFRGEITLGRIDTSVWGAFTVHDLSIKDGGETIVWIPQIHLGYSLIPLLWGNARIEVAAIDPVIDLRRESDGELNLMRALALKSPAGASSSSSALGIYIDQLGVRKGTVDFAPRAAGGPRYRFDAVDLDGSIAIKPAGLEAELSELRTRVVAPGMPPADLYAALSYGGANGPAKVRINALRLTTQASAVSITGTIHNLATLRSDVAINVHKLAASDLSLILPGYPVRQDIRGRLSLKGTANEIRTVADLTAGEARLRANFQVDLTRKAPPFEGNLSLTQLHLNALALSQKLAGVLDMTLKARGKGADLEALLANTAINIKGLRAGNTDAGNLEFTGNAKNGNLRFDGHLSQGSGRLNLNGTAIVTGNLRYDIVIATQHFDAARISKSAPPTDLNSRTTIQGSGTDLQNIDAKVDFRAVNSVIASVPVESTIGARIKHGAIDIAEARILSQGTTISFKGTAGIAPGGATRLSYRVRADRIALWLKLAGTTGDGRVVLDGTASGSLRGAKAPVLRSQGKMDLESVQLSDLSIASGHASYSLQTIGPGSWPRGEANVDFTALRTNGMKLRAIAAQVRIDGGRPPRISIAMTIHDEKNNADRLAATVVYQPKRIAGSLDQLSVMLPDGAWHLAHQAQLTKDEDRVAVRHLALVNGVRRLTLNADIASAGTQKAALRIQAIDLAMLRPLMPWKQRIAGDLSAEITLSGTSNAPLIDANMRANGLMLESQKLGDMNATVDYRPSAAALAVILNQDQSHQLGLNGDIPVNLSWSHGFAATIGNNQKMRVYSAGIQLAPFAGIAPQTLKNAAGLLQADLELTGSPLHPAVNGTMTITGAGGDIVPIGIKISDFEVHLRALPNSIEIAELSGKAGGGTLRGSGSIALHDNYSPGAIDVDLQMHQWPAIATRRYNARIDGEIHASGTLDEPRIQGQIDVVDTTIHPDLAFLTGTSVLPPDKTIVVIQPGEEALSVARKTRPRAPGVLSARVSSGQHANGQMLKNLAIDLKVNIHRSTWIRDEDVQIELDGTLNIRKQRGGPTSVVGEINTVRGWLRFHGRRFTLVNGQILFTGGSEIDPTLDIDAQYAVSEYVVDVIVAGTASKPEIKLKSQPELAQGDILSLILFGKTTAQLGQGQQAILQQQAQSMAEGAAGQALSQALGLASLGVNVNGESVGLGHYLNENTYVSISPSLAKSGSQTPSKVASIQYFLWRWLTITTATMSDGSSQVFLNVNKRY